MRPFAPVKYPKSRRLDTTSHKNSPAVPYLVISKLSFREDLF